MTALLVVALVLVVAACGGTGERDPTLDARLLEAARAGDVDAARRLIEQGADVNAKDASEQSAYLYATSEVGPDTALVELTLAHGADVAARDSYDGTGLIRAAHRGYARIAERLLEAGVDVDHVNRLGWTALLEAIVLGDGGPAHVETVRVLVEGGADVSIADGDGVLPREHAERAGYDEIVAILDASG